ncbi:hypothetical protein SAMN04515674_105282 [Pseudarcicella hirudinis]|uniref:Uncharacterized protein n=1 Tax=Pseudarcicella hirudinis TaxID=1079859 RepID=A0A1I5T0A6_9BACT|nr:hypothetical protein [Pseudarcicella hirudinis]SFP75896.1 hypothetical protein SAMN04515674_105282 [Pseudarcicella hirudinis]
MPILYNLVVDSDTFTRYKNRIDLSFIATDEIPEIGQNLCIIEKDSDISIASPPQIMAIISGKETFDGGEIISFQILHG